MWCMVVTTGTAKARHIGAALRAAREGKGLSVRALARQLEIDHSTLSMWETGKRTPRPDHVASILTALGVNGDEKTRLVDLSREPDGPQWFGAGIPALKQQMTALLEFERTATCIIDVSPLLVPGMLQTSDYVRAIMRGSGVPDEDIETRVMTRIGRRDAFQRPEAAKLTVLIGEAALRQIIGSPTVMAHQLRHLASVAALPSITLRVIPIRCDWNPSLGGPFMLLKFAEATPIVHVELRRSGLFLHEAEDVAAYQNAVDDILGTAMSPAESSGLIADITTELERSDQPITVA